METLACNQCTGGWLETEINSFEEIPGAGNLTAVQFAELDILIESFHI